MTDFATELRRLVAAATPGRYVIPEDAELRADIELFVFVVNHAEQIAALVEAVTAYQNRQWPVHESSMFRALDALNREEKP